MLIEGRYIEKWEATSSRLTSKDTTLVYLIIFKITELWIRKKLEIEILIRLITMY